jgi:mannose-6-phosphate isomerase-like protein (cupin superfamily)
METVTLASAFESIDEPWDPHLAGELNGQAVKLAKAEGEFVWHSHADADELFFVTDGRLRIEFRDRDDVTLEAGELLVVPRGTEHRPVAEPEANILLFEPAGTRNTGDVEDGLTREELERVDD